MFEVCRSERLHEEDLGAVSCRDFADSDCITDEFIGFLLLELEQDYDESYNMSICRLIVLPVLTRLTTARPERTIHGNNERRNISKSVPNIPHISPVTKAETPPKRSHASLNTKRQCPQKLWRMYNIHAKSRTYATQIQS